MVVFISLVELLRLRSLSQSSLKAGLKNTYSTGFRQAGSGKKMRVTVLAISGPPAVEPVRRGAKENAATGQKKMQLVKMSQAMCLRAPVCSGSASSTLPSVQYNWVYTAAVNR